jgi:hypothetical protein
MMTRTLMGLGVVALAAGILALASLDTRAAEEPATYKMIIPPTALGDLIKEDTKVVNDALKGPKVEKKDIKRAKVATMVLGIYAEAGMGTKDTAKMEALQGHAAKVLEDLLKDDALAEAKKDAAKLGTSGSGAKMDWLKAVWDAENKDYDRDLAMQLFKSTRAGGLGYEKKIKDFAEKDLTAKDMAETVILAYKAAMIAQAVERIGPTTAMGKKTPETWAKFAKDLQTSAVETGNAAAKKDAKATKAAIGRMDKACVNCHEVFKPN